eukprot:m51a1_g795 putative eukaryotic translation initiation factor 4e (205) ;mRNA; r:641791-643020
MAEQQQQQQQQQQQDATLKHPLQCTWTMWFDAGAGAPQKRGDWSANLKKLIDVDTVEDFWGMYNHIVPASKLALGSNYHLFKSPIEPKWEDPRNKRGGKWVLNLQKRGPVDLDRTWLYAVLACIGECFLEYSDQICGVVVSPRKAADRIALWTSDCVDADAVRAIGETLKRELELPEGLKIVYQHHEDSLAKQSSFNNTNHMEL